VLAATVRMLAATVRRAPAGVQVWATVNARTVCGVVVSRSRAPKFVMKMDVDVRPLGSAGAKVAAVLLGEADAYIHAGGFYEWGHGGARGG